MRKELWRTLTKFEEKRAAERIGMTYTERAAHAKGTLAEQFLLSMEEKKTNLVVAADNLDFKSPMEVLQFAQDISSEIIGFKFHPRVFEKEFSWFSKGHDEELFRIAKAEDFFVINDTKIDDIGKIALRQALVEMGKAHMVTALTAAGGKTLEAINDAAKQLYGGDGILRGSIPMLYMTPEGHLFDYIFDYVIDHANTYAATGGIVAGRSLEALYHAMARLELGILTFSPGIKIGEITGDRGQTYGHPYHAVKKGTDAIIVGSGIYGSKEPLEVAKEYRKQGWDGYIARAGAPMHGC